MRILDIAEMGIRQVHNPVDEIHEAELLFARGCREIEDGNWERAYRIFDLLTRSTADLPPGLAKAAETARDIVDPRNSPEVTAKKLLRMMPGGVLQIYDCENGWLPEALRLFTGDEHSVVRDGRRG